MGMLVCHFEFLSFPLLILLLSQAVYSPVLSLTSSAHLCPPHQNLALLQFMNTISLSNCSYDDPRKIPSSWKEDSDCCLWDEVTCDSVTGNVIALHLSHYGLCGTIDSNNTLFLLTQIREIDLAFNNFIGELPLSLGKLQNLVDLDLQGNNFTGQIPNAFSNLTKLTSLNLELNNFYGMIPSCLFAMPLLNYLYLNYNQLDGFHDDFQVNSSQLSYVFISNNKLNGPLPKSLFELVQLSFLDLSSNNMTGFLDLEMISKLKNLSGLDLSYNSLVLSPSRHVNYTFPMLVSLYLSSCNLTEFPIFLKDSKFVNEIDLSNNKIHGQVPEWFLGLGADFLSKLNLSHNFLTSFSHFPWNALIVLDLHSNLLQGSLPDVLPSRYLFLSNNKFSGEIPLSLCNSSYFFTIIDLSHNNLNGTIPQCLASSFLSVLDLRMNNFSGVIPTEFGECRDLTTLGLNGNNLEGVLPRSLLNCSYLEVVDVGNNKISGEFPHWLGFLPNLTVLVLRSNKFHGPIVNSETEFSFPMLRIMDVSHNEFTGPLPAFYFKNFKAMMTGNHSTSIEYIGRKFESREVYYQDHMMVTMKGIDIELVRILSILATIDLSNNNFSGKIPTNIGELKSLKGLNFSHNYLEGHIPSSMGSLTNLEWLDLSSNRVAGNIPEKLLDITFLAVLNLSYNKLVGHIPEGRQFSTFSNDSYMGNLGLCGFPLSKKCNQQPVPPPSFVTSGSVFGFGWKVVALGYGCGVIFGMIIGYLVFSTEKPRWLVRLVAEYEPRGKVRRPRNGGTHHGNRRN